MTVCYFCGREVSSGRWIDHKIGQISVDAFICPTCAQSLIIKGDKK